MRAVKAQQNLLNITAGVKGAVLRDFCPGERCHLHRGIIDSTVSITPRNPNSFLKIFNLKRQFHKNVATTFSRFQIHVDPRSWA